MIEAGRRAQNGNRTKPHVIAKHKGTPFLAYGPSLRFISIVIIPKTPLINVNIAVRINAKYKL